MAKILVTGGAGYIGSHMAEMLGEAGHKVVVLDNLKSGKANAVLSAELIVADLADQAYLDAVFAQYKFDAVMHFAGLIQVGESVIYPDKYYQNNVAAGLNLLNAVKKFAVKNFIFSSTAAVYGEPKYVPIDTKHALFPVNPYGKSKLMFEQILADYGNAFGLRSICLRYFNAAGADPLARIGENHNPETHLIPLVLRAACSEDGSIKVFGNDYNTSDGSCVRDYIHVVDLCSAHLLALDALLAGAKSNVYNLGNGKGYTVFEVIKAAEKVTGKSIKFEIHGRREGDPAVLVADAERTIKELNWQPQYPDLETIIKHAWQWEKKRFASK